MNFFWGRHGKMDWIVDTPPRPPAYPSVEAYLRSAKGYRPRSPKKKASPKKKKRSSRKRSPPPRSPKKYPYQGDYDKELFRELNRG